MPITFTLIIESTIALGIIGLAAKEIYLYRRNRKINEKNGSDTEWMKTKLREISSVSNQINVEIAVVKTEVRNFSSRHEDNLKIQSEINTSLNNKLKCLDDRVFDLATKEKE